MVRGSEMVKISKTLTEILVCPLSKQPLRVCDKSSSLISDAIGVSFPIVDGIPCLVPRDGEIVETEDAPSECKADSFDSKNNHKTT
ncbi:hypothetical protein QVD17_18856 [Tagetes erecta]|uniref:Protein preY, mitochondrial n=1 Tax=Tagetes erecta TaxID=13708 RepID=A0AAD8KNL2_TARER|nr:hypothetical protein QVD17_18856 [Tagetes erecta]